MAVSHPTIAVGKRRIRFLKRDVRGLIAASKLFGPRMTICKRHETARCPLRHMITTQVGNRSASSVRWLVIAGAVLQVLIPALPSLGIGEPIGSQSDSVRTLITPAGWAFSIWGPLFTGALVFAIYQFFLSKGTTSC